MALESVGGRKFSIATIATLIAAVSPLTEKVPPVYALGAVVIIVCTYVICNAFGK